MTACRSNDGRTGGFTRLDLTLLAAVLVLLAALAVPVVERGLRSSHERQAAAGLRTIVSAEADFKSNDRDRNGVQDYWVADLSGLCSSGAGAPRLVDPKLAAADSAPLAGRPSTASAPSAGYWYYALVRDLSTPGQPMYATDTGGSRPMGAVHHLKKFGFLAYPDRFATTGRRVFAVNEAGTVWSRELSAAIKSTEATPPGAPLLTCRNWPTEAERRADWTAE